MNERIRELAQQAGAKYFKDTAVVADKGSSGLADEFIPKFAELIVQECIGVLEGTLGMNNSTLQNMDAIKEHFGVE